MLMAISPLVQLLDTNTSNQIAAGEVVEKPASVIKELVENALDANAEKIEVTIFAGGTEYMRVVDNGCGMNEENARLSVLRHATSKIIKAEDLLNLHTLGFRGEALPSIASISNFTLLTRPENEEFATSIHIDGGENMEVSSMGGNLGTTVIVENLFFNVPARRKFLKTPATEARHISELLTKLALSRPDVRFKLVNNDKEVLNTPGDGDLLNTIRSLYGGNVAKELLPVSLDNGNVKISGFIGTPTLLKGTRAWQTFFVNGRSIGSKMLAKAIDHAYQSQIPKSGFPFAVLNIMVDTASVDVNVHPQKSEVKFSDDSLVYKAMYKALTEALTQPMSAKKTTITLLPDSELNAFVKPVIKQNIEEHFAINQESIFKEPEKVSDIAENIETKTNTVQTVEDKFSIQPIKTQQSSMWQPISNFSKSLTENEYTKGHQETVISVLEAREEFAKDEPFSSSDIVPRETIAFSGADNEKATIWPIGQVDKTFIIAQSENTLYLIDQHAAHERILYDKLVAAHTQIPSQQLLIPLYIDLDAESITLIEEHRNEFLQLGVDAEAGGDNILRISSLPSDIKADDAEDFIREISSMLLEMRHNITGSDLRQNILHMTACKAAIKAGQLLNMRQMQQLIIELCNTEHPFTCPHGRPCMIEIDSNKLYKMFKRTGF